MSKSTDSNRLPPVSQTSAAGRGGQNVVREMITKRISEGNKERNENAFIMAIGELVTNPNQPRQVRDDERDAELAADIQARGILEPIIVRPFAGKYQVVAGERRYRAAATVGLEKVPVIIQELDDNQARYVSLVENLQRQDLDKLDEARFFQQLINEYNVTYKEIAEFIHRSTYYVQERLKLLEQTPKDGELEKPLISEKSNKKEEKSRLLEKSQPKGFSFKPLVKFSNFLNEAAPQLQSLKQEEKAGVAAQIRELKQQLENLEKQLENQ